MSTDEVARQRAVGMYNFEDRGDALELDNLVRLAAEICQCEMAMVSIVDDAQEQVQAAFGVSIVSVAKHTSFCTYTIATAEMLVVEDALADPRFADNPLVAGAPHVRFYVGVPLRGVDRHALGAICVLDPSPHHLSDAQHRGLQTLAHQVELHYELRLYRRGRAHRIEDRFFAVSVDPMCIIDANGRIERANAAYCATFGFTEADVRARELASFTHDDDRERIRGIAAQLRAEPGRPTHAIARYRNLVGTYIAIDWTAVSDEVGRIYAIARDQTVARRLVSERTHLQKLDALGAITGSVAHDFNNLLAVITATTGEIEAVLPENSELRADLQAILDASDSAASLTKQLLDFIRKPSPTIPSRVDFASVMTGLQRMLRSALGFRIALKVDLAPGLWPIPGAVGQIQQVMMNLLLNARDAMPNGGTIRVIASNELREAQEWVRIRVADNGLGMNETTLLRIFEPFFTTKGPEKGTGLGLATVYTIVHQLEGQVSVSSQLGIGTEFQIELRRA